ncbi:MAG: hypothetical protein ACKVQB_10595 [Bacteroidia bacterium]
MHTYYLKSVFLIFSVSIVFLSCQETKGLSDKEKNLVADTIRQTLTNYSRDVKQAGLMAELKYLDSSADFFWVPPGYKSAILYDSVAKILRMNAPLFKSIDNSYKTLTIIVVSKRVATYNALLHSVSVNTSGKVYESDLIETGVLIKRPTGWKLLSGQTSILK